MCLVVEWRSDLLPRAQGCGLLSVPLFSLLFGGRVWVLCIWSPGLVARCGGLGGLLSRAPAKSSARVGGGSAVVLALVFCGLWCFQRAVRVWFSLALHLASETGQYLVSRRAGLLNRQYVGRVLSAMLSRLIPDGRLSYCRPSRPCAAALATFPPLLVPSLTRFPRPSVSPDRQYFLCLGKS